MLRQMISSLLRRTLSRPAFERVRPCWWYLSYFLPRMVASWFLTRNPEVHGYGSGVGVPDLVRQLHSVNALAPTRMCRVMTKYGSDKGSGWHNYTTVYSALFEEFRDQPLRSLNLALGPTIRERRSMGIYGRPGESLRGWRELFPNAHIYGADIDRSILFQDERIVTFYCDQLDRESIHDLWSQLDEESGLDIIVEDGLHTFEAGISFLEASIARLRPRGIYVIEDITSSLVDR